MAAQRYLRPLSSAQDLAAWQPAVDRGFMEPDGFEGCLKRKVAPAVYDEAVGLVRREE
jgi:hypothetical protein